MSERYFVQFQSDLDAGADWDETVPTGKITLARILKQLADVFEEASFIIQWGDVGWLATVRTTDGHKVLVAIQDMGEFYILEFEHKPGVFDFITKKRFDLKAFCKEARTRLKACDGLSDLTSLLDEPDFRNHSGTASRTDLYVFAPQMAEETFRDLIQRRFPEWRLSSKRLTPRTARFLTDIRIEIDMVQAICIFIDYEFDGTDFKLDPASRQQIAEVFGEDRVSAIRLKDQGIAAAMPFKEEFISALSTELKLMKVESA